MEHLPNTYRPMLANNRPYPDIFDPALKQFPMAYRLGDPEFRDSATERAWRNMRRLVIDHLLEIIAGSVWSEHLVLRGSLLMKAWFGDAAREPRDMDWVFRPTGVTLDSPLAESLQFDLVQRVTAHSHVGDAAIQADKITVDAIWTYERAAGRRIVFPWKVENWPLGHVQVDVVFGEELFVDPVRTAIPSSDGGSVTVWAATPDLSLAWKLLWLETDSYPQGKDLYDATLLAERTSLSPELLLRVLRSQETLSDVELTPGFPLRWGVDSVDWANFKLEYPKIQGDAEDWQKRLNAALAPLFAAY